MLLRGSYHQKVYIHEYESDVAPILNEILTLHKNIKIGSYPVVDNRDYTVMVTLESLDEEILKSAFMNLLEKLPKEIIVRVEEQ